jgi:hypothetical protein
MAWAHLANICKAKKSRHLAAEWASEYNVNTTILELSTKYHFSVKVLKRAVLGLGG